MSATWCREVSSSVTLAARLDPASVCVYSHATRLEEHFYPNSLQYNCIYLNTSESAILNTIGIQRQIISSLDEVGPTALLNPPRLYNACVAAGLTPLYMDTFGRNPTQEEQRRFLLSVALEARLSRFLKRCAHDWATGSHTGAGCTLTFLVDWCWNRAVDLKENARELTAPLFASSALPDRNVVRCLEHCVQQLTALTGLLDAVLTKCCNMVVPDALSEMEEKFKGIGTVALYFQVVQWFLRVGLLPERHDAYTALPYPTDQLNATYTKRRVKLNRLQDNSPPDDNAANKSCSLLYIDQLIEQEFGGDRIHQMWIKGGSECSGLYPPPSLYSLLRLYLLPDIAEEHKHSLVLYLLVDYSMVYDEVRYEAVIRRLMQFPTMFGLSNTAIKATQAFWHLDHRDFDFALDQLQCLTGNTLSEWQHNVVLSSLLAQKKTQAALQYLHVRKPAPIQNLMREKDGDISCYNNKVNDHDKLDDWQSCCNLYLARGLVYEALDVIRMCVNNAGCFDDKVQVLNFFFKGCRNTGHLSKVLQITLLPFEEEVFIRYLENCNESQTSDILIMYYLQQARYLEAERYNSKLKKSKPRTKDVSTSIESLVDVLDREGARDTIVEVVCSSIPSIANTVARFALDEKDMETHVIAPKPMSVYVQAKSPKNTFTYKSSFIQDTIENASETWMNKPKTRRGIKRALNIEDTPFICTPKLSRTKSVFSSHQSPSQSTPPKRSRLDLSSRTPRTVCVSPVVSRQLAALLDMPDVHTHDNIYDRSGADTPHSILKRREALNRDAPSPVDSRYLGDSDDEIMETASNHTHYSDSTNKHLRFTIPTASESGSTPSPPSGVILAALERERERSMSQAREKEIAKSIIAEEKEMHTSVAVERDMDMSTDSFVTTTSHAMNEPNPLESPPKKQATEYKVPTRKSYKDTVRARRSLSISANSSLSDDPNTSVESIADIPITLINPRYSGDKRQRNIDTLLHLIDNQSVDAGNESVIEINDTDDVGEKETEIAEINIVVPQTPKGRRGIRSVGESTPLVNRSRSVTPERQGSPVVTPLHSSRITRSRSRTPELSPRSSPLAPILEQPKQEVESEPHPERTLLSVPRLRSRSRTPERIEKNVKESPRLGVITESPTKSSSTDSPSSSISRRSLRSRSRTPEVEILQEQTAVKASPRSMKSRSKTPEKIMSPKKDLGRNKKSLSRIVLEMNAFAKNKETLEKVEQENTAEKTDTAIECTPMKSYKQVPSLMDVTLSPIVNKSVLQSSTDSVQTDTDKTDELVDTSTTELGIKPLPTFTMIQETYIEKSVLHSYQSSMEVTSQSVQETNKVDNDSVLKLPAFTTINETGFEKSVLHSYVSSGAETSIQVETEFKAEKTVSKPFAAFAAMIETDFEKSVLRSNQSSVAESSQEGNITEDKSTQNASIMTNDSDVEMKNTQWQADDSTAAVIQKEKEKIVEIEREINEIEGDMSNDAEDSESSNEESGSASSSVESSTSESDEEIISIKDTDSEDSTSSSNRLQIDEQAPQDKNKPTEENVEPIIDVQVEMVEENKLPEIQVTTEATDTNEDPLDHGQISILTDDNSMIESDKSDVNLNYSDEKEIKVDTDTDSGKKDEVPAETEIENPCLQINIIVEEVPTETPVEEPMSVEHNTVAKGVDVVDAIRSDNPVIDQTTTKETKQREDKPQPEIKKDEAQPEIKEVERMKSNEPVEKVAQEETKVTEVTEKEIEVTATIEKKVEKPAPRSRKRVKSTSSNKSTKEPDTEITEELKTPITRKRTQSNASNKSVAETEQETSENIKESKKLTQSNASNNSVAEIEQKTPENKNETSTPTRRRAKTPTSAEVRKIITRRMSREMSEKDEPVEELTPKRRSARSRSKNIDDNESIASEISVKTNKSKASEDAGVKAAPIRKGRRSILATKPDLCVIPEMLAEEGAKGDSNVIVEYASPRLTRNQKSVVESWLEPSSGRRLSTASVSELSHDDDDASSTHSAFDVQPIDRITLLNKTDFEGTPDTEELQNFSPESIASEASKQRRSRLGRAASEARAVPLKAAKITRRISVDVGSPCSPGPGQAGDTPTRSRRASFNRACEALHTPKGRRTSTDQRRGEESPVESPAGSESESASASASASVVTPSRRPRRASTQSNSSVTKSETGKRTKKMPVIEESKDTKKK